MDKPSRIVLTGASGWIGRSFIKSLIDIYGLDIVKNMELYGTSARQLKLTTGVILNINNLQDISTNGEIDLYVPLAFQTQDKLDNMTKFEYIKKNTELIDLHARIIKEHYIKRAVFFSSGIVSLTPSDVERSESYWIYKELKMLEEKVFFEEFAKQSTNVAACRLFSVSGSEMQDPKKYALGDFLVRGLSNKGIILNSQKRIYRRYVDIENVCEALIKETSDTSSTLIESTGTKVTLLELARQVCQIFDLDRGLLDQIDDSHLEPDHYYSTNMGMEKLFAKHVIHPLNLNQQIRKTAAGLFESGFINNVW